MKRVMPHASLAIVASIACSGPPFAAASAPSPEGGTEGGSSDASVPDATLSCAAFPCVIASGLAAPISVVYNGFAGYWADEGTSPSYSDGAIQKYELAGA